jgi:hypothetical protein
MTRPGGPPRTGKGSPLAAPTPTYDHRQPGPALADEVVYAYSVNPAHAGEAVFDPNGEHYYIFDRKADGHSVVVVNYRSDLSPSGPYYGWNHTGAGTAKDYDLSMPEGTRVTYYVCLGEYSSRSVLWDTCGATHSATA